jgi:hypothetical protein
LLTEGHLIPGRFFEVGYQPYAASPIYLAYSQKAGCTALAAAKVQAQGIDALLGHLLQPPAKPSSGAGSGRSHRRRCPGVSAPDLVGFTPTSSSASPNKPALTAQPLLELSEVNPTYDLDHRTSRLAAVVMWHFSFATGQLKGEN